MKRALPTAAVLAALLTAPQPALARSDPKPVLFAMTVPAAALPQSAARSVTSAALRPGQQFNLVGLSWRGRAAPRIAIRAREAGGRWTAWRALGADSGDGPDPASPEGRPHGFSDPAWTGDAQGIQLRLSRPLAGLRL